MSGLARRPRRRSGRCVHAALPLQTNTQPTEAQQNKDPVVRAHPRPCMGTGGGVTREHTHIQTPRRLAMKPGLQRAHPCLQQDTEGNCPLSGPVYDVSRAPAARGRCPGAFCPGWGLETSPLSLPLSPYLRPPLPPAAGAPAAISAHTCRPASPLARRATRGPAPFLPPALPLVACKGAPPPLVGSNEHWANECARQRNGYRPSARGARWEL